MIPQDPETLAAWREYERRNARANGEYLWRLAAFKGADRMHARRLRLVEVAK